MIYYYVLMMLLGEDCLQCTHSQHIYIYNNVMVGPHFYTGNKCTWWII